MAESPAQSQVAIARARLDAMHAEAIVNSFDGLGQAIFLTKR
jgi:hypothetical protein